MIDKSMEFLLMKLLPFFLFLIIGIGAAWIGLEIYFHFYAPVYKVECTLLSEDYSASTEKTHVAPIISNKGVATAIYTTGNPERFVTIWNCGRFGKIVSNNKKVFRLAKQKSILKIQSSDYDTRIIDIEEE
jgi:hypothetical protein